jgi:hypothetical protein
MLIQPPHNLDPPILEALLSRFHFFADTGNMKLLKHLGSHKSTESNVSYTLGGGEDVFGRLELIERSEVFFLQGRRDRFVRVL